MKTTMATRILALLLVLSLVLPGLAVAVEPTVIPEPALDEQLQAAEVTPAVNVTGLTSVTLPNIDFDYHWVYFSDPVSGDPVTPFGQYQVQLVDEQNAVVATSVSRVLFGDASSFWVELQLVEDLSTLHAGDYTLQVLQMQDDILVPMSGVKLEGNDPVFTVLPAPPPRAYVSGPDVWQLGQSKSKNYSLSFDSALTGSLSAILVDAADNVVAAAPAINLQDTQYPDRGFSLYALSDLSPSAYELQLWLDGTALDIYLNSQHSAMITVSNSIRVVNAYVQPLDSNWPTREDRELFVTVKAAGVTQAADLSLQLLDASGTVVAEGQTSRSQGTDLVKEQDFLYRLLLASDQVLEPGAWYTVRITSRLDAGFAYQLSYQVPSNPTVERLQVDSASTGRLTLCLSNIAAGELTLELRQRNQTTYEYQDFARLEDVAYDGQGSLTAQFVDESQPALPLLLGPGSYQLLVLQNEQQLYQYGFTVQSQADLYSYEPYTEATLLNDMPGHLGTGGGQLNFTFALANVMPDVPIVELVQMGEPGVFTSIATATEVQWTGEQSSDITRYRFVNTAMVDADVTIPALDEMGSYYWKVTCTDRQGVQRTLLSSALQVHATAYVGMVSIAQGLQSFEHSMGGPSFSYYVGLETDRLDLVLADTWGLLDLQQLSASLLDGTNNVVGTLSPAGWQSVFGSLAGSVVVISDFTDKEVRQLVITYGGQTIAQSNIVGLAAAGAGELSVNQYSQNSPIFTSGNTLEIELLRPVNLLPEQLVVGLSPMGGGSGLVHNDQSIQTSGSSLVVSQIYNQTLQGWYLLHVGYQGQPLQLISVQEDWENYPNKLIVQEPMDPIPVYFTSSAYLSSVEAADSGYLLFGQGFATERSYQAAIYDDNDPTLALTLVPTTVVNQETLLISDQAVQDLPRGDYRVYVLEDGAMVPTTQLLHLILRAGLKLIVQPEVSINAGAEFTFNPEVTLTITPGSFTKVKWAESLAELASAVYQDVTFSATYTFAPELGDKTLYFRFADQDGLESNLVTKQIQLVSSTLSAPTEFGIDSDTWRAGQTVTAWLRTDLPGVLAGITLHKADDTTVNISLPKTLLEYGVATYSRQLNISLDESNVTGVSFHLTDGRTGAKWDSDLKQVGFSYASELRQARSSWQRVYYSQGLITASSPVSFTLTGTSGLTATATVTYSDGTAEQTWDVTLVETASRTYNGHGTVPADASRILRVDYKIGGTGFLDSVASETIGADVTGTLRFTGLPNGSGAYDRAVLYLHGKEPLWSSQQQSVNGSADIVFSGREPGTYSYQLVGPERCYVVGEVTIQPGKTTDVSLAGAYAPASFTLQPDQSVNGEVYYHVTGVDNTTWDTYGQLGQPLTGLLIGDQVSYSVHLDYQGLLSYLNPPAVPADAPIAVDQTATVSTLNLQTMPYVTVSGRVLDAAYQQAGKTHPIAGVSVQINQSFNNNGVTLRNNQRVTTDANGQFTLQLFKDQGGTISFSKSSYRISDLELPANGYTADFALGDILAEYADRGAIRWNTLVAAPVREGETPKFDPAVAYLNIRSISVGDQPLSGYMRRSGEYMLSEQSLAGLKADDVLTLQFWSPWYPLQLVSDTLSVAFDPNLCVDLDVELQQMGYVQAALENPQQTAVTDHMLVFHKHDNPAYSYRATSCSAAGVLSSQGSKLWAGEYTLVFLRGDNLTKLGRVNTLQYLDDLGLVAGADYIRRDVTLGYGSIVDLGILPAPTTITDEHLGFLATDGTSLDIRQDGFTAANKMKRTVTVRYRVRDDVLQADGKANYLSIRYNQGENVKREAYLNGALLTSSYVYPQSISVSDMSSNAYGADGLAERQGVVSFQMETSESQLSFSASVNVWANNSWRQETIASQVLDLPFVTVSEPAEVYASSSGRIFLSGVSYKNSVVTIMDNGVEAGSAESDARGRWQTSINLSDPLQPGVHQLQARVELGDGTITESPVVDCQVLPRGAAVVDDVRIWQDNHGITLTNVSVGENVYSGSLPFYPHPNVPVRAWFKILNAEPEEVDVAALVDTNQGNSTMYEAEYDPVDGYWKVAAYGITRPGVFSIYFALKVENDPAKEAEIVSKLTGSTPIDVSQLPAQPEVDPGTLPQTIREMTIDTTSNYVDGSNSNDHIEASYNLGDGMRLSFQGTSTSVPNQQPAGSIRIQTAQGYYYTTPPTVNVGSDSITVTKTAWFSPELWAAINGGAVGGAGFSAASVTAQDTQDNLQRLDYTSTATGIAGDLYELKKGADTLGKLGKGLTALGGVSLAGNVLLGSIGTDPAELRAAASAVKDATERARLMNEIDQYADATRKSHYINSFMGGVSYGASFFGPLGKGLSYIVTTGGQVYSNSIGSEYQIWADAIISMIRTELARQQRKTGKKKDVLKPRWIMDPSGYVFEAIEDKRIEGVQAILLLEDGGAYRAWTSGDELDDIYASPAQNPLITDPEGKYAWDVSPGSWKVRFEGSGYQTLETNAMTVPPAHTEVNVGLLSTASPTVKSVYVYPDAVEIEFDSYMLPSSLNDNIALWDESGNPIDVQEIQLVDPVANTGYTGDGAYSSLKIDSAQFVQWVRVVPNVPTGRLPQYAADGTTLARYRVQVDQSVASYSSVALSGAYDQTLTIEVRDNQSISGTVKYGVVSGAQPELAGVTVNLLYNGNQLQTTTTAADGSYSFTGVAVGSYSLQFSKAAHVQRTLTVDVTAGGAFVVNTLLALRGDANLDGFVNGADIVPVNRHALGIELITSELALLAADANQDDLVNGADIVPVNRHALGIELMQ